MRADYRCPANSYYSRHWQIAVPPKPLLAEELLRQPGEILVGELIGTPDPHDNGFPVQAVQLR